MHYLSSLYICCSLKVVGRIKENPLQCELLVIDEAGERWYRENKIEITPDLPNIIRNGHAPTTVSDY